MKKKLYIFLVFTILIGCNHQANKSESGEIIILGTTDSVYNGLSIILRNISLNQTDTVKVVNGKFKFEIPFVEATIYRLYVYTQRHGEEPNSKCEILISQPGEIYMNAHVAKLDESIIIGANDNELYKTFVKSEYRIQQQINQKLSKKFGTDYIKHFEQEDSLYNEAMSYYLSISNLITNNTFNFISRHANSFAAVYTLQTKVNELTPDTLELLYNKLSPKFRKTKSGTLIASKLQAEKNTAIGQLAPDFEQPDTSGNVVKLSSFRGKFVLIDFWASWCGPCREENPNLINAYRKFGNKGFTILGVSLDGKEDKDKWLAAIREDKLEWPQVADLQFVKNRAAVMYGVTAIPQSFLIGPDGRIVAKDLVGKDLNNKLQELLITK